jgi:hypothetical protein
VRVVVDFAPGAGDRLYRALRDDADFQVVRIAPSASGRYDVVHEDGLPDGEGGTLLVEPFEVATQGEEEFLAAWNAAHHVVARAQGCLGSRLLRSDRDAAFRFVDLVRWSSPLMYARAPKPAMPFASHPALYQPLTPS